MKEIAAWTNKLAPHVIGMNALAHVDVWEKLFALTSPQPGVGGLPRGARAQIMGAIGGIDMALWDVRGKAANMPVYKLLGADNKPMAISEAEADRIKGQVAEGVEHPKASIIFEVGEKVRVTDGPFASFEGLVEEVDEGRSRVKVAVSIFGRATPVELEFGQVEKL
jgi:L-alanine-DL-glutamate epimerase-like enolase superfamily enzyme